MRQILVFIGLGFIQLLLFECHRNSEVIYTQSATQQPDLENKTAYWDLQLKQNESLFKIWLRDTLTVLNIPSKPHTCYDKREFSIADDSLSLSITQYFSSKINSNKKSLKEDNPITHVLELLTEYRERPKSPFQISFSITQEFYPSTALVKDFIYDIEDIKVIEANKVCEYTYIRGRLSGKKEITHKNQEPFKSKVYDFNWAGDTLKKILIGD